MLLSLSLAALSGVGSAVPAYASPELDRQYSLHTVGFLKSWDNVDGLFSGYVADAYRDFFARQSRFVLQDLTNADAVLERSKISYEKLLADHEILGEVARATRSESLVRTRIYKEGQRYRFVMDWLHSPRMDLMATESFQLDDLKGIEESLKNGILRMIRKVPFFGHVTGRDGGSVTVNIGATAGLRKGDVLVVATLDEVKRHPLLRTVVDWRMARTGRVEVETVEEGIAFCKVVEEEEGRQLGRFQKVVEIIPRPEPKVAATSPQQEAERRLDEPPRFGWGSAALWVGSFSRQYSSLSATAGKSGSGLFMGTRAEGQLWLNREFFVEASVGYGFAGGYSQSDLTTGESSAAGSVSASIFQFRGDFGYTYFVSDQLTGPKAWARAGYQATSYSLPRNDAERLGSSSFKGFLIGIGGDLPVRGGYGAMISLDFGLLTSASESDFTLGALSGASSIAFAAGGYYRPNQRMMLKVGFDILAQGADSAASATLTHRVVTFGPTLVYFF